MVHEATATALSEPIEPGPVARLLQESIPGLVLEVGQSPIDEVVTVRREDFALVIEKAKNDERLAFDYLRCLSGVDWLTELEAVYHLYSFKHRHSIAIKVRFPVSDPHLSSVSHLWETANWHERETQELFGIIFDGHPDPRPLLTEEGLGYYIMRKSHPLADIEEWQEDYLKTIEEAKAQMAAATGVEAPVDEKALKIQLAQQKAVVIKKARDDARAKGFSAEDEKAAVQEALKKFEEEHASGQPAAPTAPAKPVDERAAKIQLAQQKAALITKTRNEARARGVSPEEERQIVAEALKRFSEEQEQPSAAPQQAAAPAAAPAAPATAPMDRAAKIQLAQQKAALITKTREEARAKGLSPEEERAAVSEALKKFAEEQRGG